jgi:hypothetical protein
MAWRLVHSLVTLRTQVAQAAPRAVPPGTPASSWGTIGDTAHDSTSDHSPHIYAALGSTPVVCAADFPHAPALGLDGGRFTEALRQSRDPRIAYVIFNGRIFSSTNTPWVWRTYSGSDRHDTHWHISVVRTRLADDTRPWAMPSGTVAMTGDGDLDALESAKLDAIYNAKRTTKLPGGGETQFTVPLTARLDDIDAQLAARAAADAADEARDKFMLAAIQAISSNGGPEVAPVIEAINAAKAETLAYVQQLQADLQAERHANAELRSRLAQAFGSGSE